MSISDLTVKINVDTSELEKAIELFKNHVEYLKQNEYLLQSRPKLYSKFQEACNVFRRLDENIFVRLYMAAKWFFKRHGVKITSTIK